jgi:hypothetical protein
MNSGLEGAMGDFKLLKEFGKKYRFEGKTVSPLIIMVKG